MHIPALHFAARPGFQCPAWRTNVFPAPSHCSPGFAVKDCISTLIAMASFRVQDVLLLTLEQLLHYESDSLARISVLQNIDSVCSIQV